MSKISRAQASSVLTAFLFFLVWACAPSPVRLGVLLPLSGSDADLGKAQRVAVELAADRINAAGGVGGRRIDLVIADSQGSPANSLPLLKALISESSVAALLTGGSSREALVQASEAGKARRVLLCSAAGAPELADAGEWVFRNCPSNEQEAKVLADFTAYTLHASRAMVLSSDSPECRSLASGFVLSFHAEGRTATAVDLPAGRREAEETIVKAIRRAPAPHAVLLALEGEQIALAAKALRKAGFSAPLLSSNRADSGAILAEAGPAAESLLLAVPGWNPSSSEPRVSEFVSGYSARAGRGPNLAAAQAYDAVFILARAMSDSGLEPQAIRDGLLELRDVQGVAGTTTFDRKGGVLRPYFMWVVRQGHAVPLGQVQEAVLPDLQRRVSAARFGSP